MKSFKETAVSPVVGVMLMLVVTIIIAAIVSAFAGGLTGGQNKASQATIKGTFSISDGMTISNAGGDSLAVKDLIFTLRDGPTFGADAESSTAQILNMSIIRVSGGSRGSGPMKTIDGAYYMSSFNPGDTVTISASDCTCDLLQPSVAPTDFRQALKSDGYSYETTSSVTPHGNETASWAHCLRNQNSIGKSFFLEVSDLQGHSISKSSVMVTA